MPDTQSFDYPAALPDTGTASTPMPGPLRVSVVVPTCGRPMLLQRCLSSLMVQQFDTRQFEIVVVDDACHADASRATRAVMQACMAQAAMHGVQLRLLGPYPPDAAHGPAAARNRGWRHARGTIIAFTDDGTQARNDWLACGMDAFEDEGVDAVWGRISVPLHGPATDYERDAKGLEQAEFVTANCFCRRTLLARINGFDERFALAWRADADLYFRLLDAVARIVHVPEAVVVHPIRPARWGVSMAQQRKIVFDALLFKKHPGRYREKIRAGPCIDYYIVVACLVGAIAFALAGRYAMALAALVAWTWLSARFCLRRLRPTIKTTPHVIEMLVTSALIPPLAVFWRVVGMLRFRVGFL